MFVPSCVNKVLHEIIGVRSQKDAFVGERTCASQTSHCVYKEAPFEHQLLPLVVNLFRIIHFVILLKSNSHTAGTT
jgi:hypothetical protein